MDERYAAYSEIYTTNIYPLGIAGVKALLGDNEVGSLHISLNWETSLLNNCHLNFYHNYGVISYTKILA